MIACWRLKTGRQWIWKIHNGLLYPSLYIIITECPLFHKEHKIGALKFKIIELYGKVFTGINVNYTVYNLYYKLYGIMQSWQTINLQAIRRNNRISQRDNLGLSSSGAYICSMAKVIINSLMALFMFGLLIGKNS